MKFDRSAVGGGSAAYLPGTIGWYRKSFNVPKSYSGKYITILFDGIFHQSDVYINGQHLGFRPYGFCSIEYDLTPYLKVGEDNVIAVRVDCTGDRPRWYAGSGIYRQAWLNVVDPVHIKTYGTYITTTDVTDAKADVRIVSTVNNTTGKNQNIIISQRILDNNGKQKSHTVTEKLTIEAQSALNVTQLVSVASPKWWDIETPVMYTAETTVKLNNKVVDVYTTPFGIRTFKFDIDKGFILNGKQVKIKGLNLHEDAGSLGVAVPVRANERRLEILKEYGCNAIRCAHNQPSKAFLDLCDRMGFIVIDEAFDKWKSGYYEKYFDEWWEKDLENMILRDRNHPSIVLWSIGNEVQEAWDESDVGVERAKMLQDFVHRMEPTRPVTMAVQNNHQSKIAGITDVIGYNYLEARMLNDRTRFPGRIFYIGEKLPYYSGEEGNIRSYDTNNPWNITAEHDWIAGGFIWSGVDYLGEAGWPGKGWPTGLFDITMVEKPRAAFHRAMWNNEPMVRIAVRDNALDIEPGRDLWQWPRIASHWNFPQYEGLIMEVLTTTNCEEVELYRVTNNNNTLMGRKKTVDFPNHTIVWNVPYTPGTLIAKGFKDEKEVAQYTIKTTKGAHRVVLTPDRSTLIIDGQDLSHIAIHLEDEDGNIVQTDDRILTVTVEGEGKFLGLDTGDLRREESFAGNQLKTYFGRALAIVRSNRKPGQITVNVTMEGSDEIYSVIILCTYEKK
jgi:beta-galactosidase